MGDSKKEIKISVRNLVEFIMRSGDLDNTRSSKNEVEAMQAGSRIHRKIQKQMGANYTPEVPLSITVPVNYKEVNFDLTVEGRADGIIKNNLDEINYMSALISNEEITKASEITVDEIKGVYKDLDLLTEPVLVHRAQVMCYAYIYAVKYNHERIGIKLTYCNMESECQKHFEEVFSIDQLTDWFNNLIKEYAKWAVWQMKWIIKRDEEINKVDFPFPYRKGQKDLVTGVYRTILRKKNLFIEAPTGVGKTISTIFPAVKAMGMGICSKIFYLTAKTITRTVAEDTFHLLMKQGISMKVTTITAKEKICILDKPDCNPISCNRAKGHYDRVNDAVYDMLTSEDEISRDLILSYAGKHMVCPFEMSLDISLWSDAIICDYNYVFDPNVYLRRFFANEKQEEYVFLIDEAHNLVDRAREMYSAILYKDDFLKVKSLVKGHAPKLIKMLDKCNKDLLKKKRECDEFEVLDDIGDLYIHLMGLMTEYEAYLQDYKLEEGREEILKLYMDIRHFLNIYEILDDCYTIYTDYDEEDNFRIKLQCMDPSRNLSRCYEKGRSAVLFSATLLPIKYYKEQLGGKEDDYAVYAPSSFSKKNRIIMVAKDVSTKYTRRNEREYGKILNYIKEFTRAKTGNYMVFFPSYQMLQTIADMAGNDIEGLVVQSANMTEEEREVFLDEFVENPVTSRVGFCVMGGIFSEGIDLKNSRLIGVVVVGTGLPMVCNERELFRSYYEEKVGKGFEYAYLYQGMNKVLQSAGRVIRTKEDHGAILLLDERFLKAQYYQLFPREWFPFEPVNLSEMSLKLTDFWLKNTEAY
jgi:Rad3-related DNA helicase